jgi:hypothetical protein
MRISEHISYKEACGSPTARRLGIDNTPTEEQLKAMRLLANKVFEPLRNHYNVPIKIESFFRCKELNSKIGGSHNSQHMVLKNKGAAIDIDDDFGYINNAEMFFYIADNLTFDQLIWEFGDKNNPGWVHVSYKSTGNRKKISIAYKENGYTKYKHFYKLSEFILFKENI